VKSIRRAEALYLLPLLTACLNPPLILAQTKSQPHIPPIETTKEATPEQTSTPAAKTIAAILLKPLDVKKLKAGDVFTASANSMDALDVLGTEVLIQVVEVRASTKDNPDSRLVRRIEKPATIAHPPVPLRLELLAVASSDFVAWTPSFVMVDRFPCDPSVDRNKCAEPQKVEDSPPSRLTESQRFVCQTKQSNNQTNQRGNQGPQKGDCVPMSESRGVYGYPDLSLAPSAAGSTDTFAIVSAKKNVKLEKGTYLILSGPDAESLSLPHP
jgi:hypothetical protein